MVAIITMVSPASCPSPPLHKPSLQLPPPTSVLPIIACTKLATQTQDPALVFPLQTHPNPCPAVCAWESFHHTAVFTCSRVWLPPRPRDPVFHLICTPSAWHWETFVECLGCECRWPPEATSGLAVLMCLVSAPSTWFADLDLAVPETVRLDSSLHKARAQLLAKGRRHRPSRSRLRDSASSAEDGEGSDGPGGKVGATHPITYPHPPFWPLDNPSKSLFQGNHTPRLLT